MNRSFRRLACAALLGGLPASLPAQQFPPIGPVKPGFPAGMVFTPSLRSVKVSWRAQVPNIRYSLSRSTDSTAGSGSDISGLIAETSFVDATLVQGTHYFYRVSAHFLDGRKMAMSTAAPFTLMKPVAVELPDLKKPVPVKKP